MKIISDDPDTQATYEALIARGESPGIASILATQQCPGIRTDATHFQGHCNGRQFAAQPEVGSAYQRRAKAAGVDTNGAVYLSSLADSPGDPRAWVRSRGDIERLCKERNWSCHGSVTVKPDGRKDNPPPSIEIGEDILAERVAQHLAEHPGDVKRDRQEVVEEVKDKIVPRWKRKKGKQQ